jgi:hypothetical protein
MPIPPSDADKDAPPAKEIVFMAEDFRGGGVSLAEAQEAAAWANGLDPRGKLMVNRIVAGSFYGGMVCEGACMSDDD